MQKISTDRYIAIPIEVLTDERLTDGEVITYSIIIDNCAGDFTRITNKELACIRNLSVSAIKRHIAKLKACGYITTKTIAIRRIYPKILIEY